MSKKNLNKVLRANYKDRKSIMEEIGLDGFSVSDIHTIGSKIGLSLPKDTALRIENDRGEIVTVSSKQYKFKAILESLDKINQKGEDT